MKFLVFDTETTGLYKHPHAKMSVQPKIIEFGAALVNSSGEVLEELSLLINPQEPLEEIITKITGLKDEDLVNQPTFPEVYEQIRDLFRKADAAIAHNLPFDSTLLNLELQRHRLDDFVWPPFCICTVQETAPEWGRRAKLTELYERCTGGPLAQAHRALDDVMALVEVAKKLGIMNAYDAAAQGSL